MNKDTLEGKWEQLKGKIREKWGDLTDDDLDQIKGDAQQLKGRLQERYGHTKDDAEKAADDFWKDNKGYHSVDDDPRV